MLNLFLFQYQTPLIVIAGAIAFFSFIKLGFLVLEGILIIYDRHKL